MQRTPLMLMVLIVAAAPAIASLRVSAQSGKPADPAREERRATALEQAAQWKMDVLRFKNGRVREGLVRANRDDEVDFVEVNRPAGKPLNLVVMSLDPKSVARIDWMSPADRRLLTARIGPLLAEKSRVRIEAGRMEDVELKEIVRDGVRYYTCRAAWFTLESTADEDSTRRCAVRIEQVFRAFRRLIPPRSTDAGGADELRVLLFGSMDEYRRHLARHGLDLENPAYYSSARNTIAAGSDLVRYAERLAQIRRKNEELRRQYEQKNRAINQELFELGEKLKAAGFSDDQIEIEKRIRRAAWKTEYEAMVGSGGTTGELGRIDRENAARFEQVAGQMFRRLYHEAFHAYLENYAYPSHEVYIPRWLNEGLAQVFENGQIDAEDTLRIDAPDRETLAALQADLARDPLPLASLLEAQEHSFLHTHGDPHASRRHYLYSWGLAWHLAFEQDLLGSDSFAWYLSPENSLKSRLARFESLVGKPLGDFETDWREAILNQRGSH